MGMLLLKINFGNNHFENMVGIFSFRFNINHGGLILPHFANVFHSILNPRQLKMK